MKNKLYKESFDDYSKLRILMSDKKEVESIIEQTSFLPDDAKLKQRLWHIINDVNEIVTCSSCDNPVNWSPSKKVSGYRRFCSSKCSSSSDEVRNKIKATCFKTYGTSTNLTNNEYKEHYKQLMLEKYGVDNPFKSEEVQDKIKQTNLEKYGVDNPAKLKEVQEKIDETNIRKYNRKRHSQLHYDDETYILKTDKEYLEREYNSGKSITDIANNLNVGLSQLCLKFIEYEIPLRKSSGEIQLQNYISELYSGNIMFNDRTTLNGKEIDIFIPDLNVGFEYDGIYWHSEKYKGDKNYHYNKDMLASEKGIKLYHILDLEWKEKTDIVKSRISSILKRNNRIYARTCEIRSVDKTEEKSFLISNHIQGFVSSSICLGLCHENELVALMSFGKSRYNNKISWELLRFCSKSNTNIPGGASKLFKHFVDNYNPESILSYCDKRWGTGNLYNTLGFIKHTNGKPSYTYTYQYKTFESRIKYQKHKLSQILDIYDPTMSEWENMKANGYDRYWNSGIDTWIYTVDKE